MKIIISPAKTQKFHGEMQATTKPIFLETAEQLRSVVAQMDVETLMPFYKIKEQLAQKLYQQYRQSTIPQRALGTYTGIVFQYMQQASWSDEMWEYAQEYVMILDAMYGVLRAQDGILPYRLDMSHSAILAEGSLYDVWESKVQQFFANEPFILNLASKEFSTLLPQEKLWTVGFMDERAGIFKAVNTYVKMARGAFLEVVVRNKVTTREELEQITVMGYVYNTEISDTHNLVYTRITEE